MRKSTKALLVAALSFLSAIALAVGSFFGAALAFGAVALIVPGTGTPNANIVNDYLEQARDRYLTTTACGPTGANCPDQNLVGINYPASFWPIPFPGWCRSGPDGCDKWDESVGQGATALQTQLSNYLTTTTEQMIVFGYSQGGAVVSNVMSSYIAGLSAADKARIQVVTIGGIETPDGGLWSRLGFLRYIPILNVTLGPPVNPATGVDFTSYAFHYDPVADAPRYWGNAFAMINAVAALFTVHGDYLDPNGNSPTGTLPYGYTDTTLPAALACNVGQNCRLDQYGNKYVVIPATSLPIADFVLQSTPSALLPLVKPVVDLVAPVWRELAELGYDYSGNPGVATPLSVLPFNPFQDWGAVAVKLFNATGAGVQAFLRDLGLPSTPPSLVPAPAPAQTPQTSVLAAQTGVDVAAKDANAAARTLAVDGGEATPAQLSQAKTTEVTATEVKATEATSTEPATGTTATGTTASGTTASDTTATGTTATGTTATGTTATDTTGTGTTGSPATGTDATNGTAKDTDATDGTPAAKKDAAAGDAGQAKTKTASKPVKAEPKKAEPKKADTDSAKTPDKTADKGADSGTDKKAA